MKKMLLAVSVTTLLTACAPNVVKLNSSISSQEISALKAKSGENMIKGSAFLRQNGGGVVTCAGSPVALIPDIAYTREYMNAVIGSTDSGFEPAYAIKVNVQPNLLGSLKEISKATTCDAQGNFTFNDVPDGSYFILTTVTWKVRHTEGGGLMKRVEVKGNETKEVIVSF